MSKFLFVVRAAVPLNKLDCFRDLPEERACRLTDRRHMSDLVPFILKEEQSRIQKELAGRYVAVTFDGTTCLREALAIVLCYVSDEWTLEQCLIRLQLLTKSLNGGKIARELIHVLMRLYQPLRSCKRSGIHQQCCYEGIACLMWVIFPTY